MKYNQFNQDFVKKICKLWKAHSFYENSKYSAIRGKRYITDRDRFAERLSAYFKDKYLVYIDKVASYVKCECSFYLVSDHYSKYSPKAEKDWQLYGKTVYVPCRKYARLTGLRNENTMNGGSLTITGVDERGNYVELAVNDTLCQLQFAPIHRVFFEELESLHKDDRELVKFKYTYIPDLTETGEEVPETGLIDAIDAEEAYSKLVETGIIPRTLELHEQ